MHTNYVAYLKRTNVTAKGEETHLIPPKEVSETTGTDVATVAPVESQFGHGNHHRSIIAWTLETTDKITALTPRLISRNTRNMMKSTSRPPTNKNQGQTDGLEGAFTLPDLTMRNTRGGTSQNNRSLRHCEPILDIDQDLDVLTSQEMAHEGYAIKSHKKLLVTDPQVHMTGSAQENENQDVRWAHATMPPQG